MQLEPGTVLAHRFEVTGDPLGEGASGVVVPAIDRATGQAVAVKVLHPHVTADAGATQRLEAQLRTVARVAHPGVVAVHGLWGHHDRWLLVSDRAQGSPLHAQDRSLGVSQAVRLGIQVAEALMAAHHVGVIHGDVRPAKVLIGPDRARLFDFGVARGSVPAEGAVLHAGQTAPEVIAGGAAGVPADLYGLGVVLHHALHGRGPFGAHEPWSVLEDQRRSPPPVEGPAGLAHLIRALLDPDPAARPASAAGVRAALERLQRNPQRRVALQEWKAPPIRPRRGWIVHGIDPTTRAPAVVRAELSQGAASRLVARLRGLGWQVQADREALGGRDLAWVAAAAALGAVLVPLLGAVPAALMAIVWRTRSLRLGLRHALPPIEAAVPPADAQPGRDAAVLAGFLLLAMAWCLVALPALAIAPGLILVALALWSLRRRPDPAAAVRQGRVVSSLAEVRSRLEGGVFPLDRSLAVAGEIDALEAAWRLGDIPADGLIARLDRMGEDLATAPRASSRPHPSLEALRRVPPFISSP